MLFLTKNDYDKILKHCEAGLPDEACGLIGGTKDGNDKYIKKVYLLTNIDHRDVYKRQVLHREIRLQELRLHLFTSPVHFICLLYTSKGICVGTDWT